MCYIVVNKNNGKTQLKLNLTNRSTSRLEETKQEVHGNNEEISKKSTKAQEIKPKGDINQHETGTGSEQSNSQYSGRVEGITELSRDNVTSSIGTHENSVHLG